MADPFLKLRNCGCLSCELIVTILDRQRQERRTNWDPATVFNALAEAGAFFCNELYAHYGPEALGVEERLHAMVCEKIGVLQHQDAPPAPAETRPESATVH